MTVSVSFA